MPHTPYPSSYYAASVNPVPPRPELQGEVEIDVYVIGAGYTGLSTAPFLLENNSEVTVLEAAKVGFGASGCSGDQIVNGHSRDIDVIECTVGEHEARLLGEVVFEGGCIIRKRAARYGIQCDLKDSGVFAASTEKQMNHLHAQKQSQECHGHNQLETTGAKRIREVVATDNYIGGMLDMGGGHIQLLNLALGEAAAVESLGGRIYEQSPATYIERGASPVMRTPQGKVKAKFIVVAGNAYLNDLAPELTAKSMPCSTQVITTEPLNEELAHSLLPQDYCVEDCNYLLDYYRLSGDKRLVYGDGVIYGARDLADIKMVIRPEMLKTFPQLKDVKIDFAWTGNFLLILSCLSRVGRTGDNIYYSQGCSGHGVTHIHAADKVLAEAPRGQAERFDTLAGLPHYPFSSDKLSRVPLTTISTWHHSLRDKLGV